MELFNKVKKSNAKLYTGIGENTESVVLNISSGSELANQVQMIGLTEQDLSVALLMKPLIEKHIKFIVDGFYENIGREPSLTELINQQSTVERLKGTLTVHIVEMYNGKIDEEYLAQRQKIANIHQRIGLQTKWYMCAFQNMLLSILQLIKEEYPHPDDMYLATCATTKILNLEQQIVLEAYEAEAERLRLEHQKEKEELILGIGGSSENLAAVTEETSASLQQLSEQATEIVQSAKTISGATAQVEGNVSHGQLKLDEQLRSLKHITKSVRDIALQMQPLGEASNKIEDIAELIRGIANQTNLLSLNAAIEAARAGEEGRGFAVVAGEVRKLSEQTKETVGGVSDLVSDIQRQIEAVAARIPSVEREAETATVSMAETNEFFRQLLDEVSVINAKNEDITNQMEGVSSVVEDLSQAMNQVASSADALTNLTVKL